MRRPAAVAARKAGAGSPCLGDAPRERSGSQQRRASGELYTMGLAVIGSGFGRTGTMSLKAALDQLGFGPAHHMEEIFKHPDQVQYWQSIAAGKTVDWNEVFCGYHAQVDWPGAHVWRELAVAYPEAKVVHSVRPENSWWNSFSATIGKVLGNYSQMPLPPNVRAMCDAAMETSDAKRSAARLPTATRRSRSTVDVPRRYVPRLLRNGFSCSMSPKAGNRCAVFLECLNRTVRFPTTTQRLSSGK